LKEQHAPEAKMMDEGRRNYVGKVRGGGII